MGPGKFSWAVDERAYVATMEGWHDDEHHEGDDGYFGNIWFVWVDDAEGFRHESLEYGGQTPLSESDVAFLRRMRAFVAIEHTNGFFTVEWFEDRDKGEARFDELKPHYTLPEDWDE